ncbi:MAG: PL29 family lyase N-terminal domain-containing protein, partial [Petrimonas sp.]|uniref:PL29 family lyase N-terminal domain-containing protein n=1 Tax=Petrimonas sp. TaxID=2023866 RepID=UPI002B3CF5EA|nr:PL29 family lyase N-terminal domain-containing protein [Petrimonas sp.]
MVTLNDHEARIKALEDLVKTVNTDIENLKKITDALEKKVSIVSYKEMEDGSGYELTMSNNTKIVLKHGEKGEKGDKPVMGTKPFGSDNRLYWTIDGEWLLDANGNKVPATGDKGDKGEQGDKGNKGDKGDPGLTPTLRVNTAGNWEMSLDGGTTWQEVKDTDGNPVKAKGTDGKDGKDGQDGATPDLKIEETADAIIITLNGVSYTIPKGAPLPGIDPAKLIGKWKFNAGSGFVIYRSDNTGTAVTQFGLEGDFRYQVQGNKVKYTSSFVTIPDTYIISVTENQLQLRTST